MITCEDTGENKNAGKRIATATRNDPRVAHRHFEAFLSAFKFVEQKLQVRPLKLTKLTLLLQQQQQQQMKQNAKTTKVIFLLFLSFNIEENGKTKTKSECISYEQKRNE